MDELLPTQIRVQNYKSLWLIAFRKTSNPFWQGYRNEYENDRLTYVEIIHVTTYCFPRSLVFANEGY